MAVSLLELAPELLFQILSNVPVNSRLRFSQCCQYAHSLANASLQTLKLDFGGIYEWTEKSTCDSRNKILIQVPDANRYDFTTLLNLHSALLPSILGRYHLALQHLDLKLWTLTVPMAKAISVLPALQSLSIKLVEDLRIRKLSRKCLNHQHDAWQILAQSAVWKNKLRSLSINKADLLMPHLVLLLQGNHSCRELRVKYCDSLGSELWKFLENDWDGNALEILELADCGSLVTEEALNSIATFRKLKHLDLHGCAVSYIETVEQWIDRMAHVANVKPPRLHSSSEGNILEVDPAYMTNQYY
ncbi:hypothetical protein EK21DRAFT_63569 [Setomelanomma holmii]|uniref:F-box domain-containing protein n=1 Tax=Setomelanomma holmii TaxID=210430 RepID=A0A9P4HCL6_9PLEO|nr:hypothetical protein EK21DRAFT_63569 [Setomelanomma holmii]